MGDKVLTTKDGDFVEGLAKGLSVLEAFDRDHPEMTLSQVSQRTGMSPAAARRSLHTLTTLGYIRRIERRFVLSARVLALGSAYLDAANVEQLLLPELRRLVHKFGDSASIAVLDGENILYVAHYSEQRASRKIASVGTTYPAYATSLGKVLLAGLDEESFTQYLDTVKLKPLTDQTVSDRETLSKWIATCRSRGYATSSDELDYGITSLAVPVRVRSGQVVAALNSSGYTGRISTEQIVDQRLESLRHSAIQLSRVLESFPPLLNSFFTYHGEILR